MKIDTTKFSNCIAAERVGVNTLIMRRLETPVKRFDGKLARFELEHRWHASESSDISSVQGNDFSFWRACEWNQNASLFGQFELVG